jgi:DnaK suppressor protein
MREKKKQKKKVLQQKKERKKTILLKFIEECKQKLLKKYEELSNLQKSSADILFEEKGDEADIADSVLGKEMTQELSDTQRKILDLIVLALDKINKGTYGICENCGKVIEKKRLSILPWVRYCVKCQNNIEK